ncbi:hypothetical protein [Streptomyces sp. NPDC089799]|uniref:hypothetical protein n=1 Tax=Streptomyces sp. NPDC089799 TaxID=3155066 RepID=UPI003445167C
MRRARVTATAVLASAALLGLTGCNGSGSGSGDAKSGRTNAPASPAASPSPSPAKHPFTDLSGPEIGEKAYAATRAVQSMRVKGQVRDGGKPMSIDLAIDKNGDCEGAMAMGGEGTVKIVKNAKLLYFKADEKFYRTQMKAHPKAVQDAAVKQLADRWVKKTATTAQAKEMASLCDLDELLGEFERMPLARKGEETRLPAGPAYTLTNSGEDGDSTFWVAMQGEPYFLKMSSQGEEAGEMTFSEFNVPVKNQEPADKDIVDGDKVSGGPSESA